MVGINLGNMGQTLNDQVNRTAARQAKEQEVATKRAGLAAIATRESAGVTRDSIASSAESRQAQLSMYGTLDDTLAKAQDAMALSDSDNPLDKLQLWMLQQSDDRYTAEGSSRRLNYLNQATQTLGNREVINQTAFQDHLTQIQSDLQLATLTDDNDLAMLQMREAQGAELIDANVNAAATMAGVMQNQNVMQEQALSNMTLEQAKAAQQKGMDSPDGSINVGGIKVSQAKINERVDALKDRQYTVSTRAVAQVDNVLSDLTVDQAQLKLAEAQASPTGFVDIAGTQVSQARIMDRIQNLTSKDLSVQSQAMAHTSQVQAFTDEANKRYAATLTPTELNKAIIDGGKVPDGFTIDINTLQNALDLKGKAQENQVQQDMFMASSQDLVTGLAGTSSTIDNTISNLSAGSPARAQLEQAKGTLRVAASFVSQGQAEGPDGVVKVTNGLVAGQGVAAQVEDTINKEAKRLSMGNDILERAYGYQIRGQIIPDDVIVQGVLAAQSKGKGQISSWLTPANAGFFTNAYQEKYAQLQQESLSNGTGGMTDSQMKEQAATLAFEATKKQAAGGWTEGIMISQLDPNMAKGNPLQGVRTPQGVMNPQMLLTLMKDADTTGASVYQQAMNLTDEQMAVANETGDTELGATQMAQLVISLDAIKPGLGKQYVDWWGTPERENMIRKFGELKMGASSQQGIQASVETSLVIPGINADGQTVSQLLQQGYERAITQTLAKQHGEYMSFGGDSTAKQAFLLNADSTLTPSQKRLAMDTIFKPIIALAEQQQTPAADVNQLIEQRLRTATPDETAETRTLRQSILKNRDASLSLIDSFISAQQLRRNLTPTMFGGMGISQIRNGDEIQQQVRGYEWLTPAK